MPTSRHPNNDPFTTSAALQPTTSNAPNPALQPTTSNAPNPALRSQASHSSLRSNTSHASAASSRTRANQSSTLFAPTLSRRPTSRSTPRVDDGILADSDSDIENEHESSVSRPQQRGLRRVRHGSPEAKLGVRAGKDVRGKGIGLAKEEEEVEFVNRRADGGYLLGVPGVGETVAVPQVTVPKSEEDVEQEEVDAHYSAISRQYFASGASLGSRSSKKHEEELEQLRLPMMLRLREQVTERLEGERWQYESVERFHPVI